MSLTYSVRKSVSFTLFPITWAHIQGVSEEEEVAFSYEDMLVPKCLLRYRVEMHNIFIKFSLSTINIMQIKTKKEEKLGAGIKVGRESRSRRTWGIKFVRRKNDTPPMGNRSSVCGWGVGVSRKSQCV